MINGRETRNGRARTGERTKCDDGREKYDEENRKTNDERLDRNDGHHAMRSEL